MMARSLAMLLAIASCGPETTSFRTTDRSDSAERAGPPAARFDIRAAERQVAAVHVWTNGGYIGSSDEPMTHVGFQIHNTSSAPIIFDVDALQLQLFDRRGATLPPTAFTTVTPLGPARIPIAAGETKTLDAYFRIPVRPRVVETMRVRWALRINDERYLQVAHFVRDDDFPVTEPPAETRTSVEL